MYLYIFLFKNNKYILKSSEMHTNIFSKLFFINPFKELVNLYGSPSGLNLCVPLLYHKVFVPLKVHLEKDVDYALRRISSCRQESIFLVAPGIVRC